MATLCHDMALMSTHLAAVQGSESVRDRRDRLIPPENPRRARIDPIEWQQDAAGTDADAGCLDPHPREEDFGRRAGEARRRVVFGDPVPFVAELIGQPGQIDRVTSAGVAPAGTGD